jgi:hypothetical protein
MSHDLIALRLDELSNAIGPDSLSYNDAGFWTSVGATELDQQLTRLADLFVHTPENQRPRVRDAVHARSLWNLVSYVRRTSLLILTSRDAIWLRRALAIAAIEDSRYDYRDLIVSLVIVRAASEQVGLDPIPLFDWCLDTLKPTSRDTFTNARDHADSDVCDILKHFGPPELQAQRP